MKNLYKNNIINIFGGIIIMLGLYLFLTNSVYVFDGILKGIDISVNMLVPSMYGFMIISNIISNSSLKNMLSYPFSFVAKKIFKLDLELFTVYLLSLLGGYPIGAKLISDKVCEGKISVKTGEYMLNFCVNSSPAFLVAGVGVKLWGNSNLGFIVYLSQVIASVIIASVSGLVTKQVHCVKKSTQLQKNSVSQVIVNGVNSATKSMMVVCSFVVAFCAFFAFLNLLDLPENIAYIIKGVLEVTYGCSSAFGGVGFTDILIICAFTAFGGVCVLMQLMALISKSGIKLKKFILVRLFYIAISCVVCSVLLNIFPQTVNVFANTNDFTVKLYSVSPIASIFMIILGVLLLCFKRKYDRI